MIQILYWLLLLGTPGHTQEVMHKTENGIYPIYYSSAQGQDSTWTKEMQAQYDGKMDDTIREWCVDKATLAVTEQSYEREKAAGHFTQFDIKIASLKQDMEKLSGIVIKGTHKEVSEWPCP